MLFQRGTFGRAEGERVGDQAHGRPGGKMYVPRATYSFRMSFWMVPRKLVARHPLLLGHRNIHAASRMDAGAVDRHARWRPCRGESPGTASPCPPGNRSPRPPCPPRRRPWDRRSHSPSASASRRPPTSRSVPARAGTVALVGFLGGAEPRVLPHGPEPATVHGGLYPAGEGIRARESQVPLVVLAGQMERGVHPLQRNAGCRGECRPAFRRTRQRLLQQPLLPGASQCLDLVRLVLVHNLCPSLARPRSSVRRNQPYNSIVVILVQRLRSRYSRLSGFTM